MDYNLEHGITPTTIQKDVRDTFETIRMAESDTKYSYSQDVEHMDEDDLQKLMNKIEKEMKEAARELQFERAAALRDRLKELQDRVKG